MQSLLTLNTIALTMCSKLFILFNGDFNTMTIVLTVVFQSVLSLLTITPVELVYKFNVQLLTQRL